jgi:tetratricopeptide (TPR) repeat protein
MRAGSVFAAPFLPAILVASCWIWWAGVDGGYFGRHWYPAALGTVLLAMAVTLATGRLLPPGRAMRVAIGLLIGFVALAFLSMAWAGSPGAAWEASDKLLLYLATAWCLALLPWRVNPATAFVGAWALGIAIVCGDALLAVPDDADLGGLDTIARLASPMGYTNATAALAWMAFFPALVISYRRGVPPVIQAAFLAVAAFLLEFGLIPQSRGAVAAVVVALVVLVAFSADRPRLVLRLVALGGLLLLALDPILDVQSAADVQRGMAQAVEDASARILLTLPVAVGIGFLIALAESWVDRDLERSNAVDRAARYMGIGLLGAALVAASINAGTVAEEASDRWERLTNESFVDLQGQQGTRFRTLDTQGRTDAWRVAVDLFEENPAVGVGAGNYEREHTARRKSLRHSRYVHSLALRSLAEAGVVGTLLLVGLLLAAILGILAGVRRMDRRTRTVIAGCLAVTAFFLVQASVDWLEEFPALAAPAIGLLFIAMRLAAPVTPEPVGRRLLSPPAAALVCALGVVAFVALALPYMATKWEERAFSRYRSDLAGAYADLDRAKAVNPLSIRPLIAEGTIAIYVQDPARAKRAFRQSLEIEENWYAHLELGLLYAETGQFSAAERQISIARDLNRVDVFLRPALRRIRRRQPVDALRFNRRLLEETRAGFTRPAS